MFDVAPTELLLVAVVAIVVIGPKDLPKAMRVAGYWVGKARGVARQFRSGFDEMLRESELMEMEKKWSEENARIMREHPSAGPALPAPADPGTTVTIDAAVMTTEPVIVDQPTSAEAADASAPDAEARPAMPVKTRPPRQRPPRAIGDTQS